MNRLTLAEQRQKETLTQKTQSLELLYEVVAYINENQELGQILPNILSKLGGLCAAHAGVVRLLYDGKMCLQHSYGLEEGSPYLVAELPLRQMLQNGELGKRFIRSSVQEPVTATVMSIPIQYHDIIVGQFCFISKPDLAHCVDEIEDLSICIGRQLGIAIEQSRLNADADRLNLVEERTRLANELHDSLAQTLASLRIQIRVLDETLHQGDESVTWQELEKIETSVEYANQELRNLIARFRAPMQEREVTVSINNLIKKFRKETDVTVYFQNEWSEDTLAPQQRTDIVRIVQEALTNVHKHADAKTARVMVRHTGEMVRVLVEDDGIGFEGNTTTSNHPGEHLGLTIMRERADNLNADFRVESEITEGTRVSFEFEPVVETITIPDQV